MWNFHKIDLNESYNLPDNQIFLAIYMLQDGDREIFLNAPSSIDDFNKMEDLENADTNLFFTFFKCNSSDSTTCLNGRNLSVDSSCSGQLSSLKCIVNADESHEVSVAELKHLLEFAIKENYKIHHPEDKK